MTPPATPEDARLEESRTRHKHWKRWGPYVSERAWGTVREDYSEAGQRGCLALTTIPGSDGAPAFLFCENDTNTRRLYGTDGPQFPKDAINDHVVNGAATVNPDQSGTKAAAHYRHTLPAHERAHDPPAPRAAGFPPRRSTPSSRPAAPRPTSSTPG